MNPDAYMPFYGNDFFQAIEGHSDSIGIAYQRCIWYYWHQTHCEGLKNDSEFLRRLCRCERPDWELMESVIFDNEKFFTLGEDGMWHQKRASQEWQKSVEKYLRSIKGAKARWNKQKGNE